MDPSYNSFGSFDSGGQPIASGAVMPADDTKKKKRWLIIGAILAVVAVAGVVGFLLMSRKETAKTVAQKLNEYSNYLLYGTDSSEEINIGTTWPSNFIAEKINNGGENYDEVYFGNLINKFDTFASAFSKKYKEEDFENNEEKADEYELMINLIDSIKISLGAIKGYAGKTMLTEQQIKESSIESVEEYYSDFAGSDNYILQKIAASSIGLAQAAKDGNADAADYFSRELARIKRNLASEVVSNSAWFYDVMGRIEGEEK